MYEYKAQVVKVIDGDTIDVRIDLGFSVFRDMRLRLERINAPEMKGEERDEGRKAKDALTHYMAMIGGRVIIKTTQETDKYGRYLADVFDEDTCINDWMVDEGHAQYAVYGLDDGPNYNACLDA